MPRRPLGHSGQTVTAFGLGCAGIAGLFQTCPPDQAQATLAAAWDGGMRHFDTAPFYGNGLSELRLGEFLSDKPRDAVLISTKAGRLLTPVSPGAAPDNGFVGGLPAAVHFDYSHDGILRSVEQSLTRLGVARIDLLYVHDIGAFAHGDERDAQHMADLTGSGRIALERLKAEGVIGGWGLGVNEIAVCLQMLRQGPLDAILLAGRVQSAGPKGRGRLVPMCQALGVPLIIGGVLNSGILATGSVPGARFDYAPASPEILARVAAMELLCGESGSTILSAALNFPLQSPAVASVLIGAADPASLRQSLSAAQNIPATDLYGRTAGFALH